MRTNIVSRKKIKEIFPEGSHNECSVWLSHCRKNLLKLADKENLNDIDLINSYVMVNPYVANEISKLDGISLDTALKIGFFMIENFPDKKSFIPKVCFEDFAFSIELVKKEKTPEMLRYLGENLTSNVQFMQQALSVFSGQSLVTAFYYVGSELTKDVDFMKYWIAKNPDLEKFADKTILALVNSKEVEVVVEVSNEVEKPTKRKRNSKKETKVVEVKEEQDFEEILKNAKIEDFKHTQTGEELKVLKIKDKIEDFKSFNMYLIKNEIAYYSKYAKGFVVKNIEKLQGVAATTTALYSPEVLEVFAKGTLF